MQPIASIAAFAFASLIAGTALAGPPITTSDTTRVFLGVNITFGQGIGSEGVVGVERGVTHFSGSVEGVRGTLHFGIGPRFVPSKIKISGLFGEHDLWGNAGVGYDLNGGGILFTGGVNAPYATLGADYALGGGFTGFAGLSTQSGFDLPQK